MEEIIRQEGAIPAAIAVLDGRVCVGMDDEELERLSDLADPLKLSSRDLAAAVVAKTSGGTTVAGTLRVAALAGIRVFATGGIGGVHRHSDWDISADLAELAAQQVLLVCAGAKAILDLPATLEQFETLGIPVVGYEANEFPAFYSVESGSPTSARVEDAEEAAALAREHWGMNGGGILLAAPPPSESALPRNDVEGWIEQALGEAELHGISGQAVTPFLLLRLGELSQGKTLEANLALLKNNARIAAQVAKYLPSGNPKIV
jgi:pseudouridine-5'-phosphate glycosidase